MNVLPLHPAAEAVLGSANTWTRVDLAAAMADQSIGVTAALIAGFPLGGASDPDASMSVETAVLLEAAQREAELFDDVHVRCEHLLMGIVRALGARGELKRVRAHFQKLMAARAFGDYVRLKSLPRAQGAARPCAVVLAGVPGTGKSTLAEALSRELRAPVFSIDWELGALVPFGVLRTETMEPLSEVMLAASMARQLQLGLDVILDATTLHVQERQRLRMIVEALDAVFVGVECRCSDEEVHRSRLAGRDRGIPGWPATVSWEHVMWMRERWEPWQEPHLIVDSAVESPDMSLGRILDLIRSREVPSCDPATDPR